MTHEIRIKENIDKDIEMLIHSYWLRDDKGFVNKPLTICNENNLTTAELNSIIKQNSECAIFLGVCDECKEQIKVSVYSQSSYKEKTRVQRSKCKVCESEYHKKRIAESNPYKQKRSPEEIKNAVENNHWENLNLQELNVLKYILTLDRNSIFKKLFKEYSEPTVWRCINKLEDEALIWLTRNEAGQIIKINFLDELRDQILQTTKATAEGLSISFTFPLIKNEAKRNSRHPDYIGSFEYNEEIKLMPNTKYACAAWLHSDGSINLKIQTYSNLENRMANRFDLSYEPQHVRDILARIFDKDGVERNPFHDLDRNPFRED